MCEVVKKSRNLTKTLLLASPNLNFRLHPGSLIMNCTVPSCNHPVNQLHHSSLGVFHS